MMRPMLTAGEAGASLADMVRRSLFAMAALPLSACVTLKAPEKPIEINLNINIKQEVVYRLDSQSKDLIKQQPGIF